MSNEIFSNNLATVNILQITVNAFMQVIIDNSIF